MLSREYRTQGGVRSCFLLSGPSLEVNGRGVVERQVIWSVHQVTSSLVRGDTRSDIGTPSQVMVSVRLIVPSARAKEAVDVLYKHRQVNL